jgi:general secretion pathway protein G
MREESLKDWLPLKGRWLGYLLRTLGWGCRIGATCGMVLLWHMCLPVTMSQTPRGQFATAQAQIAAFETALIVYRRENGRFPTTAQGLQALLIPPEIPPLPRILSGPYLKDCVTLPVDPWNNAYQYQAVGRNGCAYYIVSNGSDHQTGGDNEAADLTSGSSSELGN